MPLTLPQSCATCQHYAEADHFCAHPNLLSEALIDSYIPHPARVVCDLWEPLTLEADDVAAPV